MASTPTQHLLQCQDPPVAEAPGTFLKIQKTPSSCEDSSLHGPPRKPHSLISSTGSMFCNIFLSHMLARGTVWTREAQGMRINSIYKLKQYFQPAPISRHYSQESTSHGLGAKSRLLSVFNKCCFMGTGHTRVFARCSSCLCATTAGLSHHDRLQSLTYSLTCHFLENVC